MKKLPISVQILYLYLNTARAVFTELQCVALSMSVRFYRPMNVTKKMQCLKMKDDTCCKRAGGVNFCNTPQSELLRHNAYKKPREIFSTEAWVATGNALEFEAVGYIISVFFTRGSICLNTTFR